MLRVRQCRMVSSHTAAWLLIILLPHAVVVSAGVVDLGDSPALRQVAASTASSASHVEVTSLPGWEGQLPSRMFSGHTSGGSAPDATKGEVRFHWIFIESEGSPKDDPVIVWYQGGPGASSLFGMLVENGPLLLNAASYSNPAYNRTKIPQLVRNDHAWTKVANMLYVDSPAPVGFSFCTGAGQAGKADSCGPWNDATTAKANHEFLTNWFNDVFPSLKENDVYIAGESYGGIYVPALVREFVRKSGPFNLKGFAVGDGCIGTEVLCGGKSGPYYNIEFMHGHGQFSQALYREIRAKCPEDALREGGDKLSSQCQALVKKMETEIGGYFAYGLYDECVYEQTFAGTSSMLDLDEDKRRGRWYGPPRSQLFHLDASDVADQVLKGALNDYECPTDAMAKWLALPEVRRALGCDEDAFFFNGDNAVGFPYTTSEPNLLPFYAEAILDTPLKVLVYNGDTDPSINSMVTQDKYFDFFARPDISIGTTKEWRPWTIDGKQAMGGYVTETEGNFAYLTIRGSGHMVPEFKPVAALEFLRAWLANEDWKPYTKPQ